jgi:hypothetical protein
MKSPILLTVITLFLVPLTGCLWNCGDDFNIASPNKNGNRLDVGLDALLQNGEVVVSVSARSHGYIAKAKGHGTIPGGEYAGRRFHLTMEAEYSGIGFETLLTGEALVKIRDERFESIEDPLLQSFCCGEGHLLIIEDGYVFVVFGQVLETTADDPHNHLFAALANENSGTLNMTIADQTGTVVEPIDPPHDPGIGAIIDFDANYIRVDPH